jgi:hypothetical protein
MVSASDIALEADRNLIEQVDSESVGEQLVARVDGIIGIASC